MLNCLDTQTSISKNLTIKYTSASENLGTPEKCSADKPVGKAVQKKPP